MTAAPHTATGVTLPRVIRSEWIKLRGQRSSWWVLSLSVAVPLLAIVAWGVNAAPASPSPVDQADAVLGTVTSSVFEVLVLFVLLGSLVGTSEFESRTITTTMAAVPRRWPVVLAKLIVVACVAAAIALVVVLLGFLIAGAMVSTTSPVGLGEPGILPALLGTVLFEVCAAMIAVCVALVLRSSLASVAATFGFLYIVPSVLNALPVAAMKDFAHTFPGLASDSLTALAPPVGGLPYGAAAIAVLAWTALWVVIALLVTRRRDV